MSEVILAICAVVPAIVLAVIIFLHDKIEKEPIKLLVLLVVAGAISAIPVVVVEVIMDGVISAIFPRGSIIQVAVENFIGVALIEELGKFFATRICTWKSKEFDYLFDGIIYAVFASLGFAGLENILYVTGEATFAAGLELSFWRGILSVPLHCFCGVFMGYFYGLARQAANKGDKATQKKFILKAILIPTALHGFYDFCCSLDLVIVQLAFYAFVIVMYVFAFRRVFKSSKEDRKITPEVAAYTAPSVFAGQQPPQPQAYQAAPVTPHAQPTTWYCPQCGTAMSGNFCSKCGTKKPF